MNLLKIDERTTINLDRLWRIKMVDRVEHTNQDTIDQPAVAVGRIYQVAQLDFGGAGESLELTEDQTRRFLESIKSAYGISVL